MGWKQKCQRALLPPGSSTPCCLYISPNGRTFRTMVEVELYTRQLEKQNIEMEQDNMEKKILMLNITNRAVNNDGNGSPLACSSCRETFLNAAMLKKHRENHVQQQINQLKLKMSNFQCIQCEHTFTSLIEKTLHMKKVHSGTKCNLCGCHVSSEIKLELHLQRVHTQEAPKNSPSVLKEASSLPSSRALPLSKKYMGASMQPSLPSLTFSLPSKVPCLPLPPLPTSLHPPCCPPCPAPRTTQTPCTGDWPAQAGRPGRGRRAWKTMWSLPATPSLPGAGADRLPHLVIQQGAEVLRQQKGQGAEQGAGQGAGHGAGQGAGQGGKQGTGQGAGQGAGRGAGQGTWKGAGIEAAAEPHRTRRARG